MSSNVIVDSHVLTVLDDRRSRTPRILNQVLIFGLCAVLIFGVLAFGAVEEWSTFAFEAGATALFLIWVGKQLVHETWGYRKILCTRQRSCFSYSFSLRFCSVGLPTPTLLDMKHSSMSRMG